MDRSYKDLVFTKHALERLNDRSLTQDFIFQTVHHPDRKMTREQDAFKFIRMINGRKVHVVASPIENNRWLIISAWVRGEDDKVPLVWQLITLPFRLIYSALREIILFSRSRMK